MEILYVLVILSLAFSFGFLAFFFWAVDTDQFRSMGSVPWSILDDEDKSKKEIKEEDQ